MTKLLRKDFPILEFDASKPAVIEPSKAIKPIDIPEHAVICFFREVIEKIGNQKTTKLVTNLFSEIGINPIYEIEYDGQRIAIFHPGVGASLAAGLLEEVIALGCRKFIAVGGAGVLDKEIAVGHIVIPTSAVRDEGTSYHYLPPSREVGASKEGIDAIERILAKHECKYLLGKTWTTDAFYRETPNKVKLRREEGCLTVEMEAAAFFAVAQFREVILAQILYGGDDVSCAEWDGREKMDRKQIREDLFWFAVEACLEL
ncbi:MAG TPA: nucleoside phosphorylase [Candidatus Lokiarchaeia archaeon]|nr:nucleoside phosphorylase [Candidatus Lokiarchaeia archaeon]